MKKYKIKIKIVLLENPERKLNTCELFWKFVSRKLRDLNLEATPKEFEQRFIRGFLEI